MIYFTADWCPHCRRMDGQIQRIPDTISKFAYYPVNADQNPSLTRKFKTQGLPTVVFVKPDGTEFHRWSGAYPSEEQLKQVLEDVRQKAGTITSKAPARPAQGSGAASAGTKSAAESVAAGQLQMAESSLKVGRKDDAVKTLRQIIDKYPGTEAAARARDKLDELDSRRPAQAR